MEKVFFSVSFVLYAVATAFCFVFALLYLLRKEFLPYHSGTINKKWAELDPLMQTLIRAFLRVTGGGSLVLAVGMVFLLVFPFRAGQEWVLYCMPVMSASLLLPAVASAYSLHRKAGAKSPWKLLLCLLVMVIAAFVFSLLA